MEYTYQHLLEHKGWTDGNPENPLNSALIWAKPKGWDVALYVTITPSTDGTPMISPPQATNTLESLLTDTRKKRECDIINASNHHSGDWRYYLTSLALAYVKGPELKKLSPWQRIVAWFYRHRY